MALRTVRIGAIADAFQYDDGEYSSAFETNQPVKAGIPIDTDDVVRLGDLGVLYPLGVTDVDDPAELALIGGSNGMLVLVYKENNPGLNEYTLYAYDGDGPALNSPYVVDAFGVGNERWIAIAGKYRIFTTMYALTVKNPPIDADKVIYRDSAASDVLVTSTWTQVKAFLKTYFDTLYGTLGASHARAHTINSSTDHTDTNMVGISNNDLMQWDDPSSKWLPKSIAEVVSAQNISPGDVDSGGVFKVSSVQVVGAQQASEADLSDVPDCTGTDTIDQATLESYLGSINTTLNSLLAKLRTHGLIDT